MTKNPEVVATGCGEIGTLIAGQKVEGTATAENSMATPPKIKYTITI